MLPASTGDRKQRDISKGKLDGRSVEIQRLIGRSLRVAIDFEALGERTIYLDCDVLTADGGTRCASITGAYVALDLACRRLVREGKLERSPLTASVAAISAGIVGGVPLLDLDYSEDSTAEVDANVVMTGDGGLIEVQATAERTPLSRAHLDDLLALAADGIERLRAVQADAVGASVRLVLATRNAHKAREFATLLAPHEIVALPGRRASCRPRPARRSSTTRATRRPRRRARPACRRSPTTRGSRRRRSAARPACARRASRVRTQATRRTSTSCCARRPRAPRWHTSARSCSSTPTARSCTPSRAAAPAR